MKHNTDTTSYLMFDSIADEYDAYRPRYPEALFDDICSFANLTSGARVLEVGCGTGQATIALGKRGLEVLAIDPGENLLRKARANLAQLDNVQLESVRFEDMDSDKKFDCIVSGNAFHWIPSHVAYPKSFSLLRPNGALAVFWNFPRLKDAIATRITECLAPIHHGLTVQSDTMPLQAMMAEGEKEMSDSGFFDQIEHRQYFTPRTISAKQYCQLIGTYAIFVRIGMELREKALDTVMQRLQAAGDEELQITDTVILRLARRK